jgi:hypothetical protein
MLVRLAIPALLLSIFTCPAPAQSVLRDDFEGPETSWRYAADDAAHKLEAHQRVQQNAHSGRWCERLTVRGNNGTYIYYGHAVGSARVINELRASVWLKADRAGLQVLARVVLPRASDPRSGKPLSTLIRGSAYTQVGTWQQLRIENMPQLLERQVRVLRTQFGPQVDAREAYVDRVLLNMYGGPGVTSAWIDDLEVVGMVPVTAVTAVADHEAQGAGPTLLMQDLPPVWAGGQSVPTVALDGPLLLVGNKPFFPRVIEHRGEPLARLQKLGFNAVRIAQVPSVEMLREAAGLGMWVVAPPPPPRELESRAGDASGARIPGQFDPVLAWDLGRGLATSEELSATKRWAKLVAAADPRDRPLVCDADSDLNKYSRVVNILLAHRDPLGSSLQLSDYATWLRDRGRLARGGTPFWATVQTDLPPALTAQMTLLSGGQAVPSAWQESQIRAIVHAALCSGVRGLCFESHSRLDADDPQTRRRSAILQLLNLELDLIERWPAAGSFAPNATTNDRHVSAAVIETDRSRLLLPIYWPPQSQLVMSNTSVKALVITVVGVPEGDNAYELSPTSFRPLPSKRVPGGTQVTLSEGERDSLIVFTQDQVVIKSISERLARIRKSAAQLSRAVAKAELQQVDLTERRLAEVGRAVKATQSLHAQAEKSLEECDTLLAKNDLVTAYYRARQALQSLRDIERAHWGFAVPATDSPLEDPFTANFGSLPQHYRFAQEMTKAARSANRLAAGEIEDLDAMMRAGWKYFEHRQAGITTTVDLLPQAAHSGRMGLRLRAVATDPEHKPALVETPPLWITTAPVSVESGQLVQIQGWLRITQPITGSVDGLLVIDSLSGEALALHVAKADNWRQFTMYRAASRSGSMTVTFAMSGLGAAWIDDVTIQVVQRGGPTQQAQQTRLPSVRATGP